MKGYNIGYVSAGERDRESECVGETKRDWQASHRRIEITTGRLVEWLWIERIKKGLNSIQLRAVPLEDELEN